MSDRGYRPFGEGGTERRRARRARIALSCTLRRQAGSAVWAETIDLGEAGMSVRAVRPLRPDELVEFDLTGGDESHLVGRARVVRHQAPRVYGLRFEQLRPPVRDQLREIVDRAAPARN